MIQDIAPERKAPRTPSSNRAALLAMLEAMNVALVGASPKAGSFGRRLVAEVAKSPAAPRTFLVNPRHSEIGGMRCHRSLANLPEPVDLILLGVPDAALEEQLALAAERGDRSAVIFGNAYESPRPDNRPCELGRQLDALDINPLICGPDGAVAVDALAVIRSPT